MTYTSHADLGGRDGYGPVLPEPEGELFHAPWESRVLALTLSMGAAGAWNIDISRSARETLPDYAKLSYYEIWFAALLQLLAERGLVTPDEIDAARVLHPPLPVKRVLAAADVAATLARGAPTTRPATGTPRFSVGQRVRTRREVPAHHTRLPGYARGKCGTVERLLGAHVFADAHAQGLGEDPQWLYTVVFDGAELWETPSDTRVSIDAWEPYLEPA